MEINKKKTNFKQNVQHVKSLYFFSNGGTLSSNELNFFIHSPRYKIQLGTFTQWRAINLLCTVERVFFIRNERLENYY